MNFGQLRENKRHMLMVGAGPAVLLIIGLLFFLSGGRYVSTDNAYIKSETITVSSEVGGRITVLNVTDNSRVKAGQILFSLEQKPFELAVTLAEAALANVVNEISGMGAGYLQKQAELAQAEESLRYKSSEYARFVKLAKTNAASKARLDEAANKRLEAIKIRDALRQELAGELAKIGGAYGMPIEEHPRYKEAQATLEKAKLDLSHATVRAPADGIAANVTLNKGEYVGWGLPLFSIVNDHNVWIEANFKETDLTHVRPGQNATAKVDTYGKTWRGKVASITPATGAEFSILPPQNSSGNWVKVVQRIMVKITLEDYEGSPPLAAGMSTDVTIDTGHSRLSRWLNFSK